ncbi:HAD domain-containing protein [Kordia sp.]|uniref:HAD domain-containing protein n=1 Tax=Kordia sp. TaxID=1965332 RepID=UPI003D270A96
MILYLDIDGVMIPANSWRRPEILEDGFPAFSSMAITALNKIISKTCADIVLTTSHKHTYSLGEWYHIFNRRDILVQNIKRLPKNINHLNRREELIQWFDDSRSKDKFIIIDDDKSLNALPKNLKDKLIQTSGSVGLTYSLADEALDKIEKLELATN